MTFKNSLKDQIKMVTVKENNDCFIRKLFKNEDFYENRYYRLAHITKESEIDLDKIDLSYLENYLNNYYLKVDEIDKRKLLSDLATFKTYRNDLELHLKFINLFLNVVAIIVAGLSLFISSLLISSKADWLEKVIVFFNSEIKLFNLLILLAVIVCILGIVILIIWNRKNETPYKLKNINNAIYILEAIKEGMYQESDGVSNKDICLYDERKYDPHYEDQISEISTKLDKLIESSETNGRNGIDEEKIGSFHTEEMQKLRQETIRDMSALAVIFLWLRKLTDKKRNKLIEKKLNKKTSLYRQRKKCGDGHKLW